MDRLEEILEGLTPDQVCQIAINLNCLDVDRLINEILSMSDEEDIKEALSDMGVDVEE
jgi:hypothetical protein